MEIYDYDENDDENEYELESDYESKNIKKLKKEDLKYTNIN